MGQVMIVVERFIERTKLAILHGACTAWGIAGPLSSARARPLSPALSGEMKDDVMYDVGASRSGNWQSLHEHSSLRKGESHAKMKSMVKHQRLHVIAM